MHSAKPLKQSQQTYNEDCLCIYGRHLVVFSGHPCTSAFLDVNRSLCECSWWFCWADVWN